MQFALPPAPMRLCLLPLTLLLASGCVGAPSIVSAPSACSTLLPAEWRAGVPGADLPDGSTVGEWIAFADAQTGQLDKANDRTAAAIGIVERCEDRDREAVKRSRRKFLGLF
jgi:hypothetical protein